QARSDRKWTVIALAEAAEYDRAVRLVADQPDVRDVEEAGHLLCYDGKEPLRRRLARNEHRDLPQRGLLDRELACAPFRALERLAACGLGTARARSADEIRLATTQRLRHGHGPVVEDDLATVARNVERRPVPRHVAVEQVAIAGDQQIGASRHEIGIATSQPGVLVAPGIQETPLRRPGRSSHQLQASRVGDPPGAR